MKPLTHPFQLTPTQKWHNVWYGVAVALAVIVLAAVVGNMNINEDAMGATILITLGVVTGITLRLGTKRGWTYHAERYQPGTPFVFTKELKLGALWRILVVWFGGRLLTGVLVNQADSDASLALLFFAGAAVVIAAALIVGLRFGWQSADVKLANGVVAAT
jgi:hypothetical protein